MGGHDSDLLGRFQQEAKGLGIDLAPRQLGQFAHYLRLLREWNRVFRLVARDDEETVVWVHFMDSLSACPLLRAGESLLDVGSGAGFPGVPLKIACPSVRLTLVESRGRKVSFLKQLVRELDLRDVAVHAGRIEQLDLKGRFDTIISRALAPPQRWLSWVFPLLEEEGRIVLMLGPRYEMAELEGQLHETGLSLCGSLDLRLPVVGHRRRLAVLRRG
jgi:16S rRNA (guanine527-N7)-methyltransferase